MARVHRLLCVALGVPPTPEERITWTYADTDAVVHTERITPLDLLAACDLAPAYVALAHLPSDHKRVGRAYTVRFLNTVLGAPEPTFHTVTIEQLQRAMEEAVREDNHATWFACEFDQMRLRDDGLLHHDLLHLERAIGEAQDTKRQRIDAQATRINHAMLCTGLHVAPGGDAVLRWQVENLHGDEHAKGYLAMTPEWLARYVYVVAVPVTAARAAGVVTVGGDGGATAVETMEPWDVLGMVLTP